MAQASGAEVSAQGRSTVSRGSPATPSSDRACSAAFPRYLLQGHEREGQTCANSWKSWRESSNAYNLA